ncbi:MAG: rhomboid family intramembrane serine protease [Thermoprotei archaeon]|jgi:rhomboid protease GluP
MSVIRLQSATLTLIIINVIVFIPISINDTILVLLAQNNLLVKEGFVWQLITSMFVHFGIFHLLFNMFALYYFGGVIEYAYGKSRFLIIYFISGIAGNIATYFLLPYNVLSGGASGAIFGLLGAYVILSRNVGGLGAALVYALWVFLASSIIPGVNIVAHLIGLISGIISGAFLIRRPRYYLISR